MEPWLGMAAGGGGAPRGSGTAGRQVGCHSVPLSEGLPTEASNFRPF